MPFEVKVRPVDFNAPEEPAQLEPVKSVAKSRFKRLFERQFASVVKVSVPVPEKPAGNEELNGKDKDKDCFEEFEPSSVCLRKMVQNFIEESNEKHRCGRRRCNCFNGDGTDSSDDDVDSCSCFGESNISSIDACEILKCLVGCGCVNEANLLAEIGRIVEKNKITKRKDDFCRKIVIDGLISLGYDASICKSRWEKTPSCPAGEYEYIDVIIEGERLIIDINLRSEFEIARPSKKYRTILQTLPVIFVGKADRLQRIICLVSEAAKQSLKKKGLDFPPWRKAEYVKSKWLSAYTRTTLTGKSPPELLNSIGSVTFPENLRNLEPSIPEKRELIFEKKSSLAMIDEYVEEVFSMSDSPEKNEGTLVVKREEPSEIKPKNSHGGVKITSGLSCIIEDKP